MDRSIVEDYTPRFNVLALHECDARLAEILELVIHHIIETDPAVRAMMQKKYNEAYSALVERFLYGDRT